MARTPGRTLLLRRQTLIDAVDATIELVKPLRVVLRLAGCGLRFRKRRLGRAIGFLQSRFQRIDALADRRDLFADIGFRGAAAEADGTGQCHHGQQGF
ncbi:hypothetical protein GGR49_002912 [Sphingomonas carotinifaciens]|nr:hypothetical protein [Sphingomonas carotinifaciens]